MQQILTSINPANNDVVGSVNITPTTDIPGMVQTARRSLEHWQSLSPEARGSMLIKAGEALAEQAEELGSLLSQEMGKPLSKGISEVRNCGQNMANKVYTCCDALNPVIHQTPEVKTIVSYEAIGVVAVISPWNYPMAMPQQMIIPALMAGNTVLLKPSEETPLVAQRYVEALNQFLPEGVIQIVHGDDAQGAALVDADVNLVAFTGSREVGIKIMQRCASKLKHAVLELGGKDPLIVTEQADIEDAAQFAVASSFENAGQMCVSTERVFVHNSVADKFEQRVTEIAGSWRVGPWDEANIQMGPMIHAQQKQHVMHQVDEALNQGARLLTGGQNPAGNFVSPMVLTGVSQRMQIAQVETFGPVLSITRYQDLQEAISQANDTPFGLGATVFSSNPHQASEIASQLQAGMIGINKSIFAVGDTPWVGAKQSGFGYHGSPDGTRQFSQARVTSEQLI